MESTATHARLPKAPYDISFISVNTEDEALWPPFPLIYNEPPECFPPPGDGPRISDLLMKAAKAMVDTAISAAEDGLPLPAERRSMSACEVDLKVIARNELKKSNLVSDVHAQLRSMINVLDLPTPDNVRLGKDGDDKYREQYLIWGKFWVAYSGTAITTSDFFDWSYLSLLIQYNVRSILRDLGTLLISWRLSSNQLFRILVKSACDSFGEVELSQLLRQGQQQFSIEQSFLPSETGLGFLARCSGGAKEEELGIIHFECITNDRLPSHSIKLLALKNIFSRQLPKMPREYIVRLVFDVNHYTTVLMKGNTVVGGCCFRPFFTQRFAEIAFLAVTSTEQVKGYGTRIMSHLKEHVKSVGIRYFLTYADNFAVGYFKKQGFTTKVSQPKSTWMGYIKDYEGGTLMECEILPYVDYLKLPTIIQEQQAKIRQKIESEVNQTVYPGLQIWKQDPNARPRPISIPGFKEAGWTEAMEEERKNLLAGKVSLCDQINAILDVLIRHENSWPFRKPVSAAEAADYHMIIKNPMDIQTMKKKSKKSAICNS